MSNHFPSKPVNAHAAPAAAQAPVSISPEHVGGIANGHAASMHSGGGVRGRSEGGGGGGGESGEPAQRVRVILVGRTGQDAALRLDRSVELLRAHQPLGAIGELASPMDEGSPALATVIVGPDAVTNERAREFVSALRRVLSSVRVLAISEANRPEFDGTIPSTITPDALRRLVHSVHGPTTGPVLGLDEGDALELGEKTDEDEVLDVLMGGRSAAEEESAAVASVERRGEGGEGPGLSLVEDEESVERREDEPVVRPAGGGVESARSEEPARVEMEAAAERGVVGGGGVTLGFAETGVIEALLLGVEPNGPTVEALQRASGLADLEIIVHDDLAEPERVQSPPEGPHIKLVHAGLVMGYLVSPSGGHLGRVTPEQVHWASLCLALSRKHRQLSEYAFTDELTGAFNRRFFNQFMGEALSRAKVHRQFVTLLYFDIDDFKLYNDRFGHDAGDDILLQTVALLKSVIRPSDKVCRLGGDEFAVIFYDPAAGTGRPSAGGESALTDARSGGAPQSISEIAKRFQKQICEHRFPKLAESAPGTLTISGGMATFPWDGLTPDELLRRADELLLQSKAQGKNLITFGPGAQQVCDLNDGR